MEKILLIQNTMNPTSGALDFACYLATLANSKLTGVFLENVSDEEKLVEQKLAVADTNPWPVSKQSAKLSDNIKIVNNNITNFRKACERRSTRHSVHVDSGNPLQEIARESRYADLIVMDPETTLKSHPEEIPSSFLTHILKEIECPAFIAPQSFEGTDQIIFAYDGSKSSMHAIKQFCYLFPQLDDKKVVVFQVDEGNGDTIKNQDSLREWMSAHYSSIGFVVVKGDAETELLAYLIKKENAIVVMGAYEASSIFKRSHADRLIKVLNHPIFIAHP